MYKILCVGPAWVGDMVMAQSLFKALKKEYLDSEIDVIGPEWSISLTKRMREINSGIVLGVKAGELKLKQRYQLAQNLKAKQYNQAFILPNSFKSALIPFLAGIPIRTGFRGEMRYGLINNLRVLNKKKYPLMVQRFVSLAYPKNMPLANHIAPPELQVNETEVLNTLNKFAQSYTPKPILILCPGAEYGPSKQWPGRYFAEVANIYLNKGWKVWILGSLKDKSIAHQIHLLCKEQTMNFSGLTTLNEAIDLLSLGALVIANDSGLMHIAAALKRPTVALYGSTDPGFAPPLSDKAKILWLGLKCSPCAQRICPLKHHNCMQQLSPTKVLKALEELSGLN
ncbi:MAG: rfaF [Francisellaceae bacterium]|nr:rfaF [Francisellaceae bacterium]